MKPAYIGIVDEVLRLGYSILLLNVSRLPEPFEVDEARTVVVTRDNVMDVCVRVYGGEACVYCDPDRLLDAAVVDKMLVI